MLLKCFKGDKMKIVNGYKVYTKEKLSQILKDHAEFLLDNEKGQRADLRDADLRRADLRRADLRRADLRDADLRRADLRDADLQGADLRDADLQGADLRRADLRRADLQGAYLDYSCFPLWCGGANFKCSVKLVHQLLAHVHTLNPSDEKEAEEFEEIKKAIKQYAEKSHIWDQINKEN